MLTTVKNSKPPVVLLEAVEQKKIKQIKNS